MADRSLRYIESKHGKDVFTFHVERVQYRDKKGRLVKFDKRKVLTVEVIGKKEVYDKKKKKMVKKSFKVKSYSLKGKKRKRPVSVAAINRRIEKRTAKRQKSVTMVIDQGITYFRYLWLNKTVTKGQREKAKRLRARVAREKAKRIVKKGV